MSINKANLFSSTAKLFYEDIDGSLHVNGKGLDEFLFPNVRSTLESEILLEKYVTTPEGITFRQKDSSSHVRPYKAGKGTYYSVPRSSELTTISENLRDSVIAGASAGTFDAYNAEMFTQIILDHTIGYRKTRIKLALDVFRTGKFVPVDDTGNPLEDGSIDFGRNSANDMTYDFTGSGADIDIALKNALDVFRASGVGYGSATVIMGSNWLNAFTSLPTEQKALKRIALVQSGTIALNELATPFEGVNGLYVVGRYLVPGTVFPIWILGYEPGMNWKQKVTDTPTEFMPADEMIMFSMNDDRWSIFAGMDVLNDSQKVIRTTGELTFDSFFQFDPPAYILRSQSRFNFIPGDINKIIRSTGTF